MQSSEAASRCWAAMVKASRDAMPVPTATPAQQLLRVVPVVDTTPTVSRWDWKTYVAYCFCIACAGLTKRLCRLICRYNAALQTRELGHTVLYSDVLGSTQTILDGYGTVDVCLLASCISCPLCRMTQELSVAEVHSSRRRPGGGCRATASGPRYVCSAQMPHHAGALLRHIHLAGRRANQWLSPLGSLSVTMHLRMSRPNVFLQYVVVVFR